MTTPTHAREFISPKTAWSLSLLRFYLYCCAGAALYILLEAFLDGMASNIYTPYFKTFLKLALGCLHCISMSM
jgi:hypothetical protein